MEQEDSVADTLLLLNEAISLGRRDGMASQHLGAMCDARDELERLRWIIGVVQQDLHEKAPDRAKVFLDHQMSLTADP